MSRDLGKRTGSVVLLLGVGGMAGFGAGLLAFPPFWPFFTAGLAMFTLVTASGSWMIQGRFREVVRFDVASGAVELAGSEDGMACWRFPLARASALRVRKGIAMKTRPRSGLRDTNLTGVRAQPVVLLSLTLRDAGELWMSTFTDVDVFRRKVEELASYTGLTVDDRAGLGLERDAEGPQRAAWRRTSPPTPSRHLGETPGPCGVELSLAPARPRLLRVFVRVLSSVLFLAIPLGVALAFWMGTTLSIGGVLCALVPTSLAAFVIFAYAVQALRRSPRSYRVRLEPEGLRVRIHSRLAPLSSLHWERTYPAKQVREVRLDRADDGRFYVGLMVRRREDEPRRSLRRQLWDWILTSPTTSLANRDVRKKEEVVALWPVDWRNQRSGPGIDDLDALKVRIEGHLESVRHVEERTR